MARDACLELDWLALSHKETDLQRLGGLNPNRVGENSHVYINGDYKIARDSFMKVRPNGVIDRTDNEGNQLCVDAVQLTAKDVVTFLQLWRLF